MRDNLDLHRQESIRRDDPGHARLAISEVRRHPQQDLAHTLLAWQEAGLSILARTPGADGAPAPIRVARPSNFRVMWYRFLATLGLRRSPLGGFGGFIPVPSAG